MPVPVEVILKKQNSIAVVRGDWSDDRQTIFVKNDRGKVVHSFAVVTPHDVDVRTKLPVWFCETTVPYTMRWMSANEMDSLWSGWKQEVERNGGKVTSMPPIGRWETEGEDRRTLEIIGEQGLIKEVMGIKVTVNRWILIGAVAIGVILGMIARVALRQIGIVIP